MMLVFGSTGQVAQELKRIEPDARYLSREEADLSRPQDCADAIRQSSPNVVINAAAYTAVDKAEDEQALASTVNGDAPGAMARVCAGLEIPLVHISTDYVFEGSGNSPRAPDETIAPLGAYGRTKAQGEQAIRESGATHAILRTSWVFSSHGSNFVKTMLRLGASRDHLTIVADQIGGPTPADAIARACVTIAERLTHAPELSGTYHFSGAPDVSWADFAREIFARTGFDVTVEDIPTSAYPTPAQRPLNSRLDCSGLSAFCLERPDWRAALDDVIRSMEKV